MAFETDPELHSLDANKHIIGVVWASLASGALLLGDRFYYISRHLTSCHWLIGFLFDGQAGWCLISGTIIQMQVKICPFSLKASFSKDLPLNWDVQESRYAGPEAIVNTSSRLKMAPAAKQQVQVHYNQVQSRSWISHREWGWAGCPGSRYQVPYSTNLCPKTITN